MKFQNRNIKYRIVSFGLVFTLLFYNCEKPNKETVLIPKKTSNFTWVYKPIGDYFFGPDTKHLKEGMWYNDWVPNDHAFIKHKSGKWHIFGITHPLKNIKPLKGNIHAGEYALFHAVSSGENFNETNTKFHYNDLPKVLTPKERPGEVLANHAPYIIKKNNVYYMVYGHSPIRLATSTDLYKWEPKGTLFSEKTGARDPSLLYFEGMYYMVYCSEKSVKMRSSKDLLTWSDAEIILKTNKFAPESPSLIHHNNSFYLFVCSWDGKWNGNDIKGAYQNKTHVYYSKATINFGVDSEKEITTLKAHAPEVFKDEEGQWYISSAEWPNRGVSVAKLSWE